MTPVFILCECNWDIPGLDRLPPHLHYTAGKATMPDGTEKWLAGALSTQDGPLEQREFIHLDVRFDREQLQEFAESIRGVVPSPSDDGMTPLSALLPVTEDQVREIVKEAFLDLANGLRKMGR